MAKGWKRVAERVVVSSGMASLRARTQSPLSVVLAYHNVLPVGTRVVGDYSLHLDQADFAAQLDFLERWGSVVSLTDAVAPRAPHDRSIRIAITFDDAYRGAMTVGLEELTKRGLPSTVFVAPGLLGDEGFWWDRIAPPDGRALDLTTRAYGLSQLQGRAERVLEWAGIQGISVNEVPEHSRPVTEAELLGLTAGVDVTLGSHSWSHANLSELPIEEIEEEMARSKEWLASRTTAYLDWIAYPYGLYSPTVVASASRTFHGALLVEGGLAEQRGKCASPLHLTPRINVPRGLSLQGLELRLSGMLD